MFPKTENEVTDLVTGKSIEPQDLDFFGFGTPERERHQFLHPPFNVVVLNDTEDINFIVRLEDVRFEIQALDPYADAIEV